jgi:LysM repeat protein
MAKGAKEVLALAATQVGVHEGYSGGHWNNDQRYSKETPTLAWSNGFAWCQTFQSWLLYKTGLASLGPCTASCLNAVGWFKNHGRFSEYPALGAQIFFGKGGGSHVGLVVGYDSTYVYTIEGNTNSNGSAEGDGVYRKTRRRSDTYVFGYGYPKYEGGSYSADPNATKFGYKVKKTATASDLGKAPTPATKTKVVVVKAGQTLGTLAVAAGVTLAAILSLNPGIKDPDVVHPGDKVTVPDEPSKTPTPPKETTKPKPPEKPKPTVTAFPGTKYFGTGKNNKYVTQLGKALIKYGYTEFYSVGAGPKWSESDRKAVQAFQKAQGWTGEDADGIPGKETWNRLTTGKNLVARKKKTAKKASTMSAPVSEADHTAVTYSNNLDGWIREALTVMAKHGIPGSYEGIKRAVMRESGGNPNAVNNWDSNAAAGHPSKGLIQTIEPTFRAYHVAGTSWNVFDPVANIAAGCNYAAHNYGSIDNVTGAY